MKLKKFWSIGGGVPVAPPLRSATALLLQKTCEPTVRLFITKLHTICSKIFAFLNIRHDGCSYSFSKLFTAIFSTLKQWNSWTIIIIIIIFFFLNFLSGPRSILWSHWLLLFWTSCALPHGFQIQSGYLACTLSCLRAMILKVTTGVTPAFSTNRGVHCISMYRAWRPVAFPTCHVCNTGRLPGFDRETSRVVSRHAVHSATATGFGLLFLAYLDYRWLIGDCNTLLKCSLPG